MQDEWCTIREGATRLHLDYHLAYSWVRRGHLLALPCAGYGGGQSPQNGEYLVRWPEALRHWRNTEATGERANALRDVQRLLVGAVLALTKNEGDLGAATRVLDALDGLCEAGAEKGVPDTDTLMGVAGQLERVLAGGRDDRADVDAVVGCAFRLAEAEVASNE